MTEEEDTTECYTSRNDSSNESGISGSRTSELPIVNDLFDNPSIPARDIFLASASNRQSEEVSSAPMQATASDGAMNSMFALLTQTMHIQAIVLERQKAETDRLREEAQPAEDRRCEEMKLEMAARKEEMYLPLQRHQDDEALRASEFEKAENRIRKEINDLIC